MSDLEKVNHTDIEWIKKTLSEIKDQTTKTNGRVNKLETFRTQAKTYGTIAIFVIPYTINKLFF